MSVSTGVATGILATIRAALVWHTARRNGDREAMLAALEAPDLAAFGFDGETTELLEIGRAGLAYLAKRGIAVQRAVALIRRADDEQRDVTGFELRAELAISRAELDETRRIANQMPEDPDQ